jgi:DNA primase
VYICYDNDEPGQQAAQRISRALTEQNICHEIYAPVHKDWNEELLQKKKGKT